MAACGDCVIMVKLKTLTREHIAAVALLYKAGESNKDIVCIIGVLIQKKYNGGQKKTCACGNTDQTL